MSERAVVAFSALALFPETTSNQSNLVLFSESASDDCHLNRGRVKLTGFGSFALVRFPRFHWLSFGSSY